MLEILFFIIQLDKYFVKRHICSLINISTNHNFIFVCRIVDGLEVRAAYFVFKGCELSPGCVNMKKLATLLQ